MSVLAALLHVLAVLPGGRHVLNGVASTPLQQVVTADPEDQVTCSVPGEFRATGILMFFAGRVVSMKLCGATFSPRR